ncbi:hypothetical protein [Paracoccus sp. (in: a-proteobacteria)]|uniref:hypothetical protein n=1 Tax=Paracoccus sp. TaxID=267 RepID=UPI0035AE0B5A
MIEDKYGFAILHEPSSCDRHPAIASKGHFTGSLMVGSWPGRVLHVESLLEHKWAHCLNAHPKTRTLREQVGFVWQNGQKKRPTHYFDLFVEQTDGKLIAYTVKPEAHLTASFMAEIACVARQAKVAGFVDDVRLLTDADLDPIELENARLTYAMRVPDAEADSAAAAVVAAMSGIATLGDLTSRIGLNARGYRALIRQIRAGIVRAAHHERITHKTEVFKAGTPA